MIKIATLERIRRHFHLSPAQILVLGFAAVILLGAVLLTLPVATRDGEGLRFLDALFITTSAVCVTGLVVVDTGTTFTIFGQVVVILLIQIGGLGIMTMATLFFLLVGKRITLRERLVMQEALNKFTMQGVVKLTRYILLVTFVIEGLGALILSLRFIPLLGVGRGIFYGIFHAVSAFNNAGFDLFGAVYEPFTSLTHFVNDPVVTLTVGTLIVLGGIGFAVIAEIYEHRTFHRLSLHSKVVLSTTAVLLIGGAVLFYLFELTNPKTLASLPWYGKVLAAVFHSITPRTAGFNTLSLPDMRPASIFLTILLMFIGASPASTGGGVKTSTFTLLLITVWTVVVGKRDVELFGRRVPEELIMRSLAIAMLALGLVLSVVLVLSLTEAATFQEIVYETVSAFGTVGLSLGLTPRLTDIGRILIILTMFSGRVGPLTLAMAFAQRPPRGEIRFPEEKVMVG